MAEFLQGPSWTERALRSGTGPYSIIHVSSKEKPPTTPASWVLGLQVLATIPVTGSMIFFRPIQVPSCPRAGFPGCRASCTNPRALAKHSSAWLGGTSSAEHTDWLTTSTYLGYRGEQC